MAAILRRVAEPAEPLEHLTLSHGPLVMDTARHVFTARDSPVMRTVSEFGLLRALLSAPGRVLSRGQLVEQAYGSDH